MIRRGIPSFAIALIVVGMMAPWSAHAVSPAAEALFKEGRRLLAAGRTAEACARLAESYAAEASSGTLLNLALCHEKLGKTATAWAEYQVAARLARAQGREDRAAVADKKAAAVETTLSRLTAIPTKTVPGLVMATETGTLGEGAFGVAVPVDPGRYNITVSAPGHRSWTTTVEVREHEQRTLEIPALAVVEAIPVTAPRPPPLPPAALVTTETPPESPGRSRLDVYLAGGGGALLLGGAAAWTIAYAKFDSAKDACNTGTGCNEPDRNGRISTIETLQALAIGCWIAGGGLLVASGVHYALRNKTAPVMVAIDPVNHGLAVRATF